MVNPFGKLFQKQAIRTHLSDTLEVGYNQFGPTLGVEGSIAALDKLVFVNNISILVTRLRDKATLPFSWLAMRPHRFKLGRDLGIDLKMPDKFLVTPAKPFAFNILFTDQNQYKVMNPSLKLIQQYWECFWSPTENPQEKSSPNPQKRFEDFIKNSDIGGLHSKLQKLCYWDAGEYALNFFLIDRDAKPIQEIQKLFSLNAEDAKTLRENSATILADLCGQTDISYSFAQVPLRE